MLLLMCIAAGLMALLSGCANGLHEQETIITAVEDAIPNASFVSVEHEETDNEYGRNVYTFSVGDAFTFTYENDIFEVVARLGLRTNQVRSRYLAALLLYLEDDMRNVASENGVQFQLNDLMDTGSRNKSGTGPLIVCNYSSGSGSSSMELSIYIQTYDQIQIVEQALRGIHAVIRPYVPTAEGATYGGYTMSQRLLWGMPGTEQVTLWDWEDSMNLAEEQVDGGMKAARYLWADSVRAGGIPETAGMLLEEANIYPPMSITSLYVDGEPLVSTKYRTVAVLNLEDDQYYAAVPYIASETVARDGLLLELVDIYWPNSDVDTDTSANEVSFRVNGDSYRLRRVQINPFGGGPIQFYKNGVSMDIPVLTSTQLGLDKDQTGYYVHLDAFAALAGMSVDHIDYETGAAYLTVEK